MRLAAGDRLGQFEIVSALGAGGMGEVYRARDLELERDVALKVLTDRLAHDPGSVPRFQREARALAALSHPHILTIFAFGSKGGTTYAVSELLEGETLRERLERTGADSWRSALEIGLATADGLAAAHAKGITHRDIKPGNLFLTTAGDLKILDFGLAKSEPLGPVAPEDETQELPESATVTGALLGTVGYMSPEQAKGAPAGPASDVFSLGTVLYELLTGTRPFARATPAETLAAILGEEPPEFEPAAGIPKALQRIVLKALRKDPANRLPTGVELHRELRTLQSSLEPAAGASLMQLLRRPRVAAAIALSILLAAALGIRAWLGAESRRRALESLPEISRLIAAEEFGAAFDLAVEVEPVLLDDPTLTGLWDQMSNTISVDTDPAGAEVFYRANRATESDWQPIGLSPIVGRRLPLGGFRLRIEKPGFDTRVLLSALSYPEQHGGFEGTESFSTPRERNCFDIRLDPSGTAPEGMLAVDGGPFRAPLRYVDLAQVDLPPFFIDRTEVTNAQFKEFVDAGGYENPDYWQEEFRKQGRLLTGEQAMAELVDATGMPGPSAWELGDYPEGEDDYPVRGVSWYEAAAYAASRGLSLPTVYHWSRAGLPGNENVMPLAHEIIPLSNFGTEGVAEVGSYAGIGVSGAADLAGNVREWCWNPSGPHHFALGGGWSDPTYHFTESKALDPFDRNQLTGFRCMKERQPILADLRAPLERQSIDPDSIQPFTDEEFAVWTGLFWYDPAKPLAPRLEATDESSHDWVRKTVSIAAAYGSERFDIHLDLPREGAPPYSAVLYFPGYNAFEQKRFEDAYWERFDYIPKSGRILVRPILAGMYERSGELSGRELVAKYIKDIRRTVDYLESRDDLVAGAVAYMGLSEGAYMAPVVLSTEKRFSAAVLIAGGLGNTTGRFASRVTTPTLLLSGRFDAEFPLETNQRPFMEGFGTPAADKRHAVFEAGHLPLPRAEMIRETLGWLDRYQGTALSTESAGGRARGGETESTSE